MAPPLCVFTLVKMELINNINYNLWVERWMDMKDR